MTAGSNWVNILGIIAVMVAIPTFLYLRWRVQEAKKAASQTDDEVVASGGAMHSILGLEDRSAPKPVEVPRSSPSKPVVPAGTLTVHGIPSQKEEWLGRVLESPAPASQSFESLKEALTSTATTGEEIKQPVGPTQSDRLDVLSEPSSSPPEQPKTSQEESVPTEEPTPHVTASSSAEAAEIADIFVKQMQPEQAAAPVSEEPPPRTSVSHSADWLAGLYQRPQSSVPAVVEESKPPVSASQPVSWQDNVVQQEPLPASAAATEGSNTMDNSNVINFAAEVAHSSQSTAPAMGFREQLAALNTSWHRIETAGKEVEDWFHRQQDRVLAHIERHASGAEDSMELSRDYLEQKIQHVDAEWFRIHKAVREMNRWLDATAPAGQLEQLANLR